MFPRSAGILLHVTSLPSRFGVGDLGPHAHRFVDFLHNAGQTYWQVLPLVPVGYGDSPYASPSTFAGNSTLISPDVLVDWNLSSREALQDFELDATDRVSFETAGRNKKIIVAQARERFELEPGTAADEFDRFCRANSAWLEDYALFMAIKHAHGERAWTEWPVALRDRRPEAIGQAIQLLADEIADQKFGQFLFFKQWKALKAYCNSRGVNVVGDIPIYVAHDSADVWSNRSLFRLNDDGSPTVVSGVPPDYFSEDGQRWGNPLYRWDVMHESGYDWWIQRMRAALGMYDVIRLDHFRGFEAYWEVPANERTARNGRWVPGPGAALFDALHGAIGQMPIIAEDLGLITDGVRELKARYNFPGMAILQFGFDSDPSNAFLPHNYSRNLWAYTGTHDNETVHGWYAGEKNTTQTRDQVERAREYCRTYLRVRDDEVDDLHWSFLHALYASIADVSIAPLQDVLGLGADGRMNEPGSVGKNWVWKLKDDSYQEFAPRLRALAETFGRAHAT